MDEAQREFEGSHLDVVVTPASLGRMDHLNSQVTRAHSPQLSATITP
jgi:hypothetical protein